MGGTSLARAGKVLLVGAVFPSPRCAPGLWFQQGPSSISSTAWISALLWLHGSFFSFVILTFLLCWVCQAEVTRHALVELSALSLHKASPRHPPGLQQCWPNLQVFSSAFIQSRCLAGPLGMFTPLLALWGKNSLPPRWMIIVELYKNIGMFVPFSRSSFGDKVTSLPPRSHQESAWGNWLLPPLMDKPRAV